MNTSDLISIVEAETNWAPDVAAWLVRLVKSAITKELLRGKPVKLQGLGTLSVRRRKARSITCIETGKEISLPSQRYVHFTPASSLKKGLNP